MTPPRHVLVYIPPGAGFTQANLKELERIARWMKDAQSLGLNITEPRQAANAILRRIKANGRYPNVATLQRALLPYLVKFRKLNKALNHNNRNLGQELQNKRWPKVQEAAGKFKALRNVAALRRPPSPTSRRVGNQHDVSLVVNLMRPYMLAGSTPVTTTYNQFLAGPPRPRVRRARSVPPRRRTPSPNRAATTTRSGRRSVRPRRNSPSRG
jgi:hypothetical protein